MKNTLTPAALALAFALPVGVSADGVPSEAAAEGTFADKPFSPYANRTFPERPLWGETHLHTGLSLDAGIFGNILGPFLVYILKRDESAFVEDQAREALNFQITMTLAAIASAILMVVLIGFVLIFAVGIWWIVGTAIGASKANKGEWYRYPFTLRLVK